MINKPKTWSKDEIVALMCKAYRKEMIHAVSIGKLCKAEDGIKAVFDALNDEKLIEYTP